MSSDTYSRISHLSGPLYRIGAGFCGSVWADTGGGSVAIKREDGGPGRSLHNDSEIHQRLIAAYQRCRVPCLFAIPTWHCYVPAADATKIVHRFPSGYSSCNILLSERIPPLPADVRDLLIAKYCPPELAPNITADPRNHDCLIRPYLGRRRRGFKNSTFRTFSLRNYPLHLDQIEDLKLDLLEYARRMAQALAFMHWSAGIDANDVEFVLAPPPPPTIPIFSSPSIPGNPLTTISSTVLSDHCLWILDFDCCRPMTMDETGLKQAARAFWRNDPFYPRPPGKDDKQQRDVELWSHFKHAFLDASAEIIGSDDEERRHLPGLLLELIEAKAL
ncbi:zinc finger protein-domain-containing protein [Xylaria sp. FL0933]|nr:zinc finger protein-domain-containing protein [Xylaria sp. FL0933]